MSATENEKGTEENFGVLFLRQVSAIDSNITIESVQNLVGRYGLSWEMFEYQTKEDVVKRLRGIENLSESQCCLLFDELNRMRPNEMKRKRRDCILSIKRDFYENWIMKCMCCIFDYL